MIHANRSFWWLLILTLILNAARFGSAQDADDWQQWADLLKRYDAHSHAGQWDAAAANAERIQALVERRFPERLAFLGTVWLAQSRNGQGRYEEALSLYQASLKKTEGFRPQNENERKLYVNCVGESLRGAGVSCERLGRLEEATQSVTKAVQWLEKNNETLSAAETRITLGHYFQQLGDYPRSIEQFRLAVKVVEPVAARERTNRVANFILANGLSYWSVSLVDTGRFDQAEPQLRRALPLMASAIGWETPKTAEVLNNLGRVYWSQGRWQDSEAYFREALRVWETTQGPNHPSTATGLMNLAGVLGQRGKHAEAEAMLRRAVQVFENGLGRNHSKTLFAISELACELTFHEAAKQQEARQLLNEVLAQYKAGLGSTHHLVANTQLRLAILCFVQNDLNAALELLDKNEEINRQQPFGAHLAQRSLSLRASMLWRLGQQEEAIRTAESALEQAEILRSYASGAEYDRAAAFEKFGVDYEELIRWLVERQEYVKLFKVWEQQKARSFLDELRLKGVDLLAGFSAEQRAQLSQQENELRNRLLEAENQFRALPTPGKDAKPADVERYRQFAQALLQAREQLYRHLTECRAASPVYRELLTARTEFVSLAEMQQHLSPNELFLSYFVGLDNTYLLVVRRDAVQATRLEVSAGPAGVLGIAEGALTKSSLQQVLLAKDGGLMSQLARPGKADAAPPAGQLAALWQTLLPGSVRAALTSGEVKLLTIVRAGPLALLPFEALVVADAADNDPKYLLDAGPPIAYAPSASVLLNLARRERKQSQQRFLTLGDPAYPPVTKSTPETIDRHLGLTRSEDVFRAGLPRLPATALESGWVKQVLEGGGFSGLQLTGTNATEAALRRSVAGNQIVHLACHGMADQSHGNFFGSLAITPGKPGEPRDDGFLTMAELYELDLSACELAILSACETNFGPQQEGEGVWALSRGFLIAGSRRVVASNWVVDDRAGATLISYFTRDLTKTGKDSATCDYARALQVAKQNVRKDSKWQHPFYWSSLVLVGPK